MYTVSITQVSADSIANVSGNFKPHLGGQHILYTASITQVSADSIANVSVNSKPGSGGQHILVPRYWIFTYLYLPGASGL